MQTTVGLHGVLQERAGKAIQQINGLEVKELENT
jgi:hypothetical protein